MKNIYLILAFLFGISVFSQTTETFETESFGSQNFTDNGQVFNITTQTAGQTFAISNYAGAGWNGTAADNQFIDNSGYANYEPVQFTISSSGQKRFKLKSLYLFFSQTDLIPSTGNCTITGKLNGVTQFTAVNSTNFNSSGVNNGYTNISLSTYGGSDNSNVVIDQFVITTTGSFEYVTLDAMNWLDVCATMSLAPSQTNVSCNGGSNGVATVVASGGTPSYDYMWSPSGGTSAVASGLQQGTYSVTVTDANSCQKTQSFSITQPTILSLTAASQTSITCNGGTNGTASVNVATGGAGGYTYNWTPGNPTGDGTRLVSGLTVGTWTCTVTDANSCTATQSFNITQPTALSLTAAAQTNIGCNGGSTGAASVNVATGGTAGYTYNWTPGNPTGDGTPSVTGLTVGTWTCTVIDANSCTATQSFNITQPTALSLTPAAQTNIGCNGGSSGAASVNVATGGTAGYIYNWTPGNPTGDGTPSVTGLTVGTWTCTVTDANSCTATQSFNITQPTALSLTTASQTNIGCNGGLTGAASVNVATGGTAGYIYNWTPGNPTGDGTPSVTGLTAGTWTCTVTDANLCTVTQTFNITEPTALSFVTINLPDYDYNSAYNHPVVASGGTGAKSFSVTGGSLPAGFSLSSSGVISGVSTQTANSNFAISVTDANSCTTAYNFTLKLSQIPITVTANVLQSKEYGDIDPALTYTVTPNLLPGDSFTGSLTRAAGNDVGTYAIAQGTLSAGTKYIITFVGDNFTITSKAISIAANASQSKVYGAVDPVLTYSVSPSLVTGDSFTGTLARAAGDNVGIYPITQGSLSAGSNYALSYAGDNFTITSKAIAVTANASQSKVYGAVDPVLTYSVSPSLETGDSFTGTLARAAGDNVGSYTIGQGSLSAGSNYALSYVGDNFTITSKAIAVTANVSQSKVYGAVDPVLTYSVSPSLETGDFFTGTLARAAGDNVGTYAITQGSLSAGSNYALSYAGDNFTITSKAIVVTANVSQSKVYGAIDPVLTYSVSPSLETGDSFTGTLARTAGDNVGTYVITQGNLSAGSNYALSYAGDNFTITSKAISIAADASQAKVYGTVDPVLTYSVSPSLVTGDSFTGTLARAAGDNVGTYVITQGSLSAGSNYALSYAGDNFTITSKAIAVTANASQSKVYGAVEPILTYSVSPSLVTGDSFTGTLARAAGDNVGAYAITQGSLSAGSNYSLSYTGDNFTITSKAITVTADASQAKVYGAVDPVLTYIVSPSLETGDSFTGTLTRAAGDNVGTYAITQGSLSAGSNYALSYAGDNFSITSKTITVTANASQSKVYGAVDPVLTYSVSPSLETGDSFTGTLARAAGNNVGTYAITQGSLSAGPNYALSYAGDNFSIIPIAITVTANASQSKVYGAVDPVLTYTVSPSLVTGDSFSGTLARAAGDNVGTYAITQGSLSASSNYVLTYSGNSFVITKANQTIIWKQVLEFGCDGGTTTVLTAVSSSGLPVSYSSFNNLVSISGNSISLLDYVSTTITASQLGDANYNPASGVSLPIVNSQPNLIRKHFDSVIFFDNSSNNFISYKWYKNGVLVPSQTAQYFEENGSLNGVYYAVATKKDGTIITTCSLSIAPSTAEEYMNIVPNPVKSDSDYQLVTNVPFLRLQNAHVQVFNLLGVLLVEKTVTGETIDMKAPGSEGIYIIRMTLANGKRFSKNLLVRD
jgi:uncharacterized protein YfeS